MSCVLQVRLCLQQKEAEMKKSIIAMAFILGACENSSTFQADRSSNMAAPVMDMAESTAVQNGQIQSSKMRAEDASSPVPPPNLQSDDNPSNQNFLAYRYNYGFTLPTRSIASTSTSHAQTCHDAGPRLCQVLNSSTSAFNEDNVTARLTLRAQPEWLEGFKSNLQSSVEAAKGKMISNSMSSENLTRQILDTDARLKAQTTLRDRLQGLLATRNAELTDLLALERELARVQSEIESATTTLNVLRKRVSMSTVDIYYQSQSVAVSQSAIAPIGRALKGFVRSFSHGLAAAITFLASVLPWLLLIIFPTFWLIRRWWRSRSIQNTPSKTPKVQS